MSFQKRATIKEQYLALTGFLNTIQWQIFGSCEDEDCDQYVLQSCMKKGRFKPVLHHKTSCVPSLKRQQAAILGVLGHKQFKSRRYRACAVCKKPLDSIDERNLCHIFVRPVPKGAREIRVRQAHAACRKKLKAPRGFRQF